MYTFACRRWRCLYVNIYIYKCLPFFFGVGFDRVQAHGPDINTTVKRLTRTSAGVLSTSGTGIKKLCIVSPAWSNNQTRHQPRNYSINLCFYDLGNSRDDRNFKFKRGAAWTSNHSNHQMICHRIIMIIKIYHNNNNNHHHHNVS